MLLRLEMGFSGMECDEKVYRVKLKKNERVIKRMQAKRDKRCQGSTVCNDASDAERSSYD